MPLLVSLLLSLSLWIHPAPPATPTDITQTLGVSLRTGDAGRLSAQFAKTIDLLIDAERVEFPAVQATQAEQILRTFFRKYPPQHFQFIYRGSSDHMYYSTGTYETNGKTFSVYVLMQQNRQHQLVINTLHFRKE